MADFSDKALQEFVSEAEEILEQMETDLIAVEQAAKRGAAVDPDVVNRLFRGAHSLKGAAGMFGFQNLSNLAHHLEDLLDQLRLGKVALTQPVFDLLIEGSEELRRAVVIVDDTHEDVPEDRVVPFAARIERFLKGQEFSSGDDPLTQLELDPEVLNVLTEYEEHRLRENVRQGRHIWRVSLRLPLTEFDTRLAGATERLKQVGEVVTTLPSALEAAPDELAFDLLVGTEADAEAIATLLADESPVVSEIPRKAAPPPPPPPQAETAGTEPEPSRGGDSIRSIAKTVRVDIERLDRIMGTVGELVLVKGAIDRLVDELRQHGERHEIVELQKQTVILDRKLRELQQQVMDVRMVPLRQIFDKLQRIVRNTARDLGKEIAFRTEGADTELDKLIVEELADPLMHIIRNAIDHGIESAEEREAAGKPPVGQITIRAYQKGNHVVIEVRDDGRGIDPERVRAKAIEQGLIDPHQELNDYQLLNLLFEPGFSTKEEVSELSGRGVGLDVVKNNIAALGGLIEIQSVPGEGTVFVLTLPITLAIIQALVVAVGRESFGIPLNSVLESLVPDPDEIHTVEGRKVMHHRGQTLPLIRLEEVFAIPADALAENYVVVVGMAEKRIGLLVDRLLGQQDVVIQPISSILRKVPGIAGATDVGDNQTILVLDVAAIIEETTRGLAA